MERENNIQNLRNEMKFYAEKAIKQDKSKNYNQAIISYSNTIEILNELLNKDSNITFHKFYTEKKLEYNKRVNYLIEIQKKFEKERNEKTFQTNFHKSNSTNPSITKSNDFKLTPELSHSYNSYDSSLNIEFILNEARNLAIQAKDADSKEDYNNAFDYYVQSSKKLQLLCKISNNENNKKIYEEKGKEYAKRAKELRYIMNMRNTLK